METTYLFVNKKKLRTASMQYYTHCPIFVAFAIQEERPQPVQKKTKLGVESRSGSKRENKIETML
jgi:hypothetical protein